MSDYNYLEHERRAKLSQEARDSGPGRPRALRHGLRCTCDRCKRDRAIQEAFKALDRRLKESLQKKKPD